MIQLYKDSAGGWRWRLVHPKNGKIVAESGEDYTRRNKAVKGAESARSLFATAQIVEVIEKPVQRLLSDVVREPSDV